MNDTNQTQALQVMPQGTSVPAESMPHQESLCIPPKTAAEMRVSQVGDLLAEAYKKASTLELTPEEIAVLMARFPDESVEIRPHDGLIYIPHIHISKRLLKVFGPGKWCMIRRREWLEVNRIYAEWAMLIRGCFIGEAVGAMDYHPTNAKMNYSDALEGTRGECIRRIAAKELGVGDQCWEPDYARQWVAKHAEQRNGKWQRKSVSSSVPAATSTPARKPVEKPEAKPAKTQAEILVCPTCGAHDVASNTREGVTYFGCVICGGEWQDPPAPATEKPLAEATQQALNSLEAKEQAFGEAWKPLIVPFGKDADRKFGDLDKKDLWFWVMCWAKKPLEPREYKGKVYQPKAHEVRIWNTLNENRDAIKAHYKFSEPKN